MPSEPADGSDILISPLTFLRLYQSAGDLMDAMLEKDIYYQRWFGASSMWRRLARGSVLPTYYHWVTSGYGASIGPDLAGWLFVRGWSQVLYIETLAARRGWRRQGVGRALLRFAESLARELGRAWLGLTVTQGNTPAVALYEREGYRRGHWRVAVLRGKPAPRLANQSGVRLKPVYAFAAERAYRQFAEQDIRAGEAWAAEAILRMANTDPHRSLGPEWVIEADGKPIGFVNRHGAKDHPHLYLACAAQWWTNVSMLETVIAQAQFAGDAAGSLTLRLGSSGHHEAVIEELLRAGFAEQPAATMRLFKPVDNGRAAPGAHSGG